jgi:hypothetical protein
VEIGSCAAFVQSGWLGYLIDCYSDLSAHGLTAFKDYFSVTEMLQVQRR